MRRSLSLYLHRQASSLGRYLLEQGLYCLAGWIPTLLGIAVRGVLYRLIMHFDGWAAIENGVRLRFANHIHLGSGAYIDHGVYLHACPQGIRIGANTLVMHGAVLHVYNFRNLPHAGITIGKDSLVGEYSVIRGQGGVQIGDDLKLVSLRRVSADDLQASRRDVSERRRIVPCHTEETHDSERSVSVVPTQGDRIAQFNIRADLHEMIGNHDGTCLPGLQPAAIDQSNLE